MKILQINCVYQRGSTGKITYDLHTALQEQGETSVVCYGRGPKTKDPGVYKTCGELYGKWCNLRRRITGLMYGGCFFSTERLLHILRREKPDVVHLQCINGYFVHIYRLIHWLKKNRIKTVLTLHAEFMYTANCGIAMHCDRWRTGCGACPHRWEATQSLFFDRTAESWRRMQKAFSGFERDCVIVSVSDWLRLRAMQSPIFEHFRHETVWNGIDTHGAFHPTVSNLRNASGIREDKLVLHVTAHFSAAAGHIKGGAYVIALAKRMPDTAFVVLAARDEIPADTVLPKNLYRPGSVNGPHRLAQWYTAADAVLLTSTRETFSMVTAESLCCGTPVVGFRAGGPESIAPEMYSTFVEQGDTDALQRALEDRLRTPFDRAKIAETSCRKFDRAEMCARYGQIYRRLCAEKEGENG
ncbi:MAG: glycosyltransferase [Clostridia bacterium]|nr:glycosyltransferase [Clostridia bacterium]